MWGSSSSSSSSSSSPKAAGASGGDDGGGGGGGQLIELLKLLLNPAALISADSGPAQQILGLLAGEDASSSGLVSGRKLALSSMVLTAAKNDPEFLKRAGLADRVGPVDTAKVGECMACGGCERCEDTITLPGGECPLAMIGCACLTRYNCQGANAHWP